MINIVNEIFNNVKTNYIDIPKNYCNDMYSYYEYYIRLYKNPEKNEKLLNNYTTYNENKIFISHYEIKNKFTNITNIIILSINIDSSQNINIKLKNNNKDNYDLTENISLMFLIPYF